MTLASILRTILIELPWVFIVVASFWASLRAHRFPALLQSAGAALICVLTAADFLFLNVIRPGIFPTSYGSFDAFFVLLSILRLCAMAVFCVGYGMEKFTTSRTLPAIPATHAFPVGGPSVPS
jgi:hypothetical protein